MVWRPAHHLGLRGPLAECLEAADLPTGVVNLVTGPGPVVGDEIAANPARTRGVHRLDRDRASGRPARRGKLLLEMGATVRS